MKQLKTHQRTQKEDALQALKVAVVEGAAWRYEHLLALALEAGATDDEVDIVAHEALQALLTGAELPLNPRELARDWRGGQFRY